MKIRRFGILLTVLMAGGVGASAQTSTPTINGNVFGGGKMADVGTAKTAGTTATIVVQNSKVTGGVYGGNDIKGTVHQGTAATDASSSVTIKAGTEVGEVYGGGNGYYTYTVNNGTVSVQTIGDSPVEVATYSGTASSPTVTNTSVTIEGGKIREVYGGAKNAAVTKSGVTFANATAEKVFAGNNFGGSIQTTSLVINSTSAPGSAPDVNDESAWKEIAGVTWGIGEAFGGGNNADVSTSTSVTVNNGYIKYVFGGNNLADMNIVPDVYIKHGYINKVYGGGNAGSMVKAIAGTIDYSTFVSQLPMPEGIYNTILPFFAGTDVMIDDTDAANTNPLYIGSVYGGCRAANVNNSTYVRVTKATSIGKVFGGCDIAGSVGAKPGKLTENQTFTTYKEGDPHALVTIPGGTGTYSIGPKTGATYTTSDMIYASTYVLMNGATVGNIYGGGNGNYAYDTSGENVTVYPVGAEQEAANVVATYNNKKANSPFVTSSRLSIEGGNVTGNVYGGGNAAEVGHVFTEDDKSKAGFEMQGGFFTYYKKSNYTAGDKLTRTSYLFLGQTSRSVNNKAPKIDGNVYGGGCMANIYGTMDILVKNGMTIKNLFAGNDAAGTIYGVGRGSNQEHVAGSGIGTMLYDADRNASGNKPWLSYGGSELTSSNAGAYIRVEDGAAITNLFGGGNGDYTYTKNGTKVTIKNGDATIGIVEAASSSSPATDAKPTMAGTWVDMKGNATSLYGGGNAADVGYAHAYIAKNAKITNAYGGGNDATVTTEATITVNCTAATASTENYNVQNLYGGNNIADMNIVPTMQIMCGKIGTVYGGGNAGDMKGYTQLSADYSQFVGQKALPDGVSNRALPLYAGTRVEVVNNSTETNGLRIDKIYGGCRAANVDNSTYVEVANADHIGDIFGGCDIAGSVGMKPGSYPYAGTYVALLGGTVSGNMYASGNGNYQYKVNGNTTSVYNVGSSTDGTPVTTFDNRKVSEPYVVAGRLSVEGGTVVGNVYGGGLKAELGHVITSNDLTNGKFTYYGRDYTAGQTLSRASYLFFGKTDRSISTSINIQGDVYGGGCLANVYGTMDILVKAGVVLNDLYAGNDAAGNVVGTDRGSNFVVKSVLTNVGTMLMDYDDAETPYLSYNGESLLNKNVGTYIRVEGAHDSKAAAKIDNIFGGGNGDYTYTSAGGKVTIKTKGASPKTIGVVTAASEAAAKPVQTSTFLDIAGEITEAAYGGGNAADIVTSNICIARSAKVLAAYGGGNSATVTSKANIWVDCNAATSNAVKDNENPANDSYNVWTVFGGNNKAEMAILPTIYLQCGKIGTVYGGGNAGKMSGHDAFALDFTAYKDNECLTADVVKTATVNGKQKTYLPMFSATEVLVDSPYKLDGTTKSLLGGSPSPEDLAKSCGLRINAVYGGCRAADVDNSTYTRITRADYVGNVYAGNDIAGTVGMNPGSVEGSQPVELVAYEVLAGQTDATRYATGVKFPVGSKMVNSGSYVFITGGQIDGNLFGGGNGDYVYTTGATFSESGGNVTLPSTMKKPFSAASFVGVEGGTVKENVFGGGNKVDVGGVDLDSYDKNANPFYDCSHVFIGETARKMSSINLMKSVFGGGNSAGVVRNTHISVDKGSVIKSTLYGGCNSQGTVSGDSKIMVHSGTIGTEGSVKTVTEDEKQVKYLTDAVFGGGFGENTLVAGNVYVDIKKVSDETIPAATIYGNVYGGGNAGPVNTDCNNITETIVEGANIFGEVFGGGYGADVNGAVVLTIKDPTQLNSVEVTQTDASKTLYGNRVFATNNSAGEVKCDATLNFEANSCDIIIYGGGNKAEFKGNTNVVFTKGKVGYIYGGGNLANVVPKTNSSGTVIEPGNTNVYILGGEVCYDVFGGGKNGNVAGTANVYILDDRLTDDGKYVVDKKNDGTLVLGTSGKILINPTTNLPYQPTSVTQSSIKIGGNVYGGGQNGNVGGKANVRVGK